MSLTIGKFSIPSANFNGESSLPSIFKVANIQQLKKSMLDEDAGIFLGYGYVPCTFPYKMQDKYDRTNEVKQYDSVTLENKYLKAVFLPDFGGRLWSLVDKTTGRDLIYQNTMIRPCNLAMRNAWMSGGIEFNCGIIAHSPYTCERLFTATTKLKDGTPVLRFYAFERIRATVYQMDFFLPEDSKFLYSRMRIFNISKNTIPMYWWTNMALPAGKEYRNIMPANDAYITRVFSDEERVVMKAPIPDYAGFDSTYPINTPMSMDYFWNIKDDERKFTSYFDKDGNGFIHTSTSRLKGRKLFTFGQLRGSKRWQQFLTDDNQTNGEYIELQAGLARTQYECIPMPPKNAWEWVEAYGAIKCDAETVHGEWNGAIEAVKNELANLLDEKELEKLLVDTHEMAVTKADKVIFKGNGWGALENLLREKQGIEQMCPHLDFGEVTEEQASWVELLNTGSFAQNIDKEPPISWMLQTEWTKLIEKSKDCYLKYLHLAAIYFASDNTKDAIIACDKALSYGETATALFIKAQIERDLDNLENAGRLFLKAYKLLPNDISLARETLKYANLSGLYKEVIEAYENAPEHIKNDGRNKMYYAHAILNLGDIDRAWEIVNENGGIIISDIREAEISITSLYLDILEARAKLENKPFNRKTVDIPQFFDYRTKII